MLDNIFFAHDNVKGVYAAVYIIKGLSICVKLFVYLALFVQSNIMMTNCLR